MVLSKKFLPCKCEELSSIPSTQEMLGLEAKACNLSAGEGRDGRVPGASSQYQSQPIHDELQIW